MSSPAPTAGRQVSPEAVRAWAASSTAASFRLVDLHPTRGHGRLIDTFEVERPERYKHTTFTWSARLWACMTCGETFVSNSFPTGTGSYADDHLQRRWDAHLTPEHPSP